MCVRKWENVREEEKVGEGGPPIDRSLPSPYLALAALLLLLLFLLVPQLQGELVRDCVGVRGERAWG